MKKGIAQGPIYHNKIQDPLNISALEMKWYALQPEENEEERLYYLSHEQHGFGTIVTYERIKSPDDRNDFAVNVKPVEE